MFRPDAFQKIFIFALKKTRASGRNVGKVFNPVVKLVLENQPFLLPEPAEKPSLHCIEWTIAKSERTPCTLVLALSIQKDGPLDYIVHGVSSHVLCLSRIRTGLLSSRGLSARDTKCPAWRGVGAEIST